jgi:hypothetical protein
VVIEQWCTLTVLADNSTLLSSALFLAKESRNGHQQRKQDEHSHDDEGEDPLECDGLGSQLRKSQRYIL